MISKCKQVCCFKVDEKNLLAKEVVVAEVFLPIL